MTWALGIALGPFYLLVVLCLIRPAVVLARTRLPDSRLKHFLFISWRV